MYILRYIQSISWIAGIVNREASVARYRTELYGWPAVYILAANKAT